VVDFVEKFEDQFTKVKEVRNGFDYFFVSQRVLRALGSTLQKNFAGELKTSNTLFSRNRLTGKEIFRVTVLFRCYKIKKGDSIIIRGVSYKVVSVGKNLFIQDV
jgi:NMD protein affecting ribosome stability and mRNA decay